MADSENLFDEPEPEQPQGAPSGGGTGGGGAPPPGMSPAVFHAVTRRGFIVGVASAAAAGAAVGVGGTLGVQALTGGGGTKEAAAPTAAAGGAGAGAASGAANAKAATAIERGTLGVPASTLVSDAVVTLNVNGQSYSLLVQPQETLAAVLRGRLGLTGTKVACDHSECSACTVLLDGVPMNSCSLLAIREQGKAITTIEGLEQNGQLHPVQQAFMDNMAMQCGFCTSGQILQSVALLQRNAKPTEADIRAELSGNICKCAAYKNILAAVQDAATKTS